MPGKIEERCHLLTLKVQWEGRDGELQNGDARHLNDHVKGKLPNNDLVAWLTFQQFPIYLSPQTQLYSWSDG